MPSRTRVQLQHNFTRFRVASKSKRISAKTIILSAGGGKGGERERGGVGGGSHDIMIGYYRKWTQ